MYLGVASSTLAKWRRGEAGIAKELQPVILKAYDRMADSILQLATTGNKNYTNLVMFMLKQPQFGGYKDRYETKQETTVKIVHGESMDMSDFD